MPSTTTTYERSQFPPTLCPDWCIGEHQDALDQGDAPELAAEHLSPSHSGRLYSLHDPTTGAVVRPGVGGWNIDLRKPGTVGWKALALIHLEVDDYDYKDGRHQEATLRLTPSEALVLARALTALAESAVLA